MTLAIQRYTNVFMPPIMVALSAGLLLASDASTSLKPNIGYDEFGALGFTEIMARYLGPLVILGWYLWFDKAKSQPRRDKETREERIEAAKLYEARIDKIVDALATSLKQQAEAFSATTMKQAESFALTSTRMADVHEKMIENCSRHT